MVVWHLLKTLPTGFERIVDKRVYDLKDLKKDSTMKCLVCSAEIDELKEFPAAVGPQGQLIEDTLGKWKHVQAVGGWTHVTLTAQVSAGTVTVLSGNVCPAHPVTAESIMLAAVTAGRKSK